MESNFSMTVPCRKDGMTKANVLTISALLCQLAADQCGVSQDALGRGIMIFDGRRSARYDGPDDFAKNFPPLNLVGGFHICALYNPFSNKPGPTVSLSVNKDFGQDVVQIFVTTSSAVDAQELALQIAETLPDTDGVSPAAGVKGPLYQNREKKSNSVKQCAPSAPRKPPLRDPLDIKKLVKGLISLAALVGAVVGIFADWDQAAEKIRELLSAFHP